LNGERKEGGKDMNERRNGGKGCGMKVGKKKIPINFQRAFPLVIYSQ
jgi:hypothetical protein